MRPPFPPGLMAAAAGTALAAFAAAVAMPAILPDQPWLQALPLAVAVAIALVPVGLALLAGERWAFTLALALLLFVTDASFRSRSWADKSWDWQVLMKAAAWVGAGLAGLFLLPRWKRLLAAPPGWLTLVFLAILSISTLWSPVPAYTFEATAAFLLLFCFAMACAAVLDEDSLLVAIVLGCGAIVLPSLAIAPFAMGIAGLSPGSTGEINRLRGITDHPIPLAEVAALFTYACLALFARSRRAGPKALLALLAAAGVATAILTQSRIPVAAMAAAALGYWAYRRGGALLMGPVLVACVVVALTMESVAGFASLLPRDLLELVARSGSSSEILSLSGRLVIWPFALDRIAEAPWIGHGQASGMIVFRGFAPWRIVHAHNAYLQALLYVGLVGTVFLLAALATEIRMFLLRPRAPRDVLLLYTLFSGLTEQGMMANLPSGSCILWMVAAGMAAGAWRRRRGASILSRLPLPAPAFGGGPERQRTQRLGGAGERPETAGGIDHGDLRP